MARKTLTPTQTRRLVEKTARELARAYGTRLSEAALRALLAPSEAYFEKRDGSVSVNPERLRRELEPIVANAVKSAGREKDEVVITRYRTPGGIIAKRAFRRNPLPPPKPVRGGDVKKAMERSACHFLWFC